MKASCLLHELLRAALCARIGTANGVGFYERPPESMRAEELEPPEPGAQRLWDGNTDMDPYDDAQQPGRSRTDVDNSEGVLPLSELKMQVMTCVGPFIEGRPHSIGLVTCWPLRV